MDTQPDRPGDDRTQLIAVAADGRTASIDVGSNAFAWRLPGMALGALTVGVLYLLTRLLFRRRSVAVFAGILALAEGMLFANSRIAMNDVYITFFVLCALTLFVGLWVGRWQRAWQVIVGFIAIGLLLGLGAVLQVGGGVRHRGHGAAHPAALRPGPDHRARGHGRPSRPCWAAPRSAPAPHSWTVTHPTATGCSW